MKPRFDVETVVAKLKPHKAEIDKFFENENDRYRELLSRDHDTVGRLLKCHLILEHYIDEYLKSKLELTNLDDARLSFFQKVTLIPDDHKPAAFAKPGVVRLNAIRNRFSHNLDATIKDNELETINDWLKLARPDTKFESNIERLEAFTTLACTWLMVLPPHLEEIFKDAFGPGSLKIMS